MLEVTLLEVRKNGNLISRGCYREGPALPWQGQSTVTDHRDCNGFFVKP